MQRGNGLLTMPVHGSPPMGVTIFALGTFAMSIGGSSWLAERICRVHDARSARAHLIARARS